MLYEFSYCTANYTPPSSIATRAHTNINEKSLRSDVDKTWNDSMPPNERERETERECTIR